MVKGLWPRIFLDNGPFAAGRVSVFIFRPCRSSLTPCRRNYGSRCLRSKFSPLAHPMAAWLKVLLCWVRKTSHHLVRNRIQPAWGLFCSYTFSLVKFCFFCLPILWYLFSNYWFVTFYYIGLIKKCLQILSKKTHFSFSPRTLLNNIFTVLFYYLLPFFRQLDNSMFPKRFIFLSRDLFQVPFLVSWDLKLLLFFFTMRIL